MKYIKLFVACNCKSFYFLQKSKMEELTFDLNGMDRATSDTTLGYDQLSSMSEMSTSQLVYSAALTVWTILCRWKMFQKAGLPGWGSLIPFYNIYLRLKMAGRSGWWLLSLLFPPLFLIIMIITYFDVAKRFGKSGWFGLGLLLLTPIFIWILAFDKSTYTPRAK